MQVPLLSVKIKGKLNFLYGGTGGTTINKCHLTATVARELTEALLTKTKAIDKMATTGRNLNEIICLVKHDSTII